MNRRWLLIVVAAAFVLEVVSYYSLRSLYINGYINDGMNYIKLFTGFSMAFKAVFYGIIIAIQGRQKRYMFYSIFSVLTLIFFFLLLTDWYQNGGFSNAIWSDLSFLFSIASLVTAIYISVDPTTHGFVRVILIVNSVLLIIYRTPSYFYFRTMAMLFFGTNIDEFIAVIEAMIVVEYVVFGLWLLPQLYFIRKIDYI